MGRLLDSLVLVNGRENERKKKLLKTLYLFVWILYFIRGTQMYFFRFRQS
jgi:hypothetical protein